MLLVISPAKTLDYETPPVCDDYSMPDYLDDAQELINRARKYSVLDISEIMAVSSKIAELNFERFEAWHTPFTVENSKQAVLAFKGDVYTGLDANTFDKKEFKFAQKHLRILSGLYGLLRPLDLMQAYRLEMGRKIENDRGKNLYAFWGEIITEGLNRALKKQKSNVLINLASNEYFKAVKPKLLNAEIITPVFKDYKNGKLKIISFFAKKARGLMVRYIIDNSIETIEGLKGFNTDGYNFDSNLSTEKELIFTR